MASGVRALMIIGTFSHDNFWDDWSDFRSASPHVGWQFLKGWQEQLFIQKEERDLPRFFVYTSNVDAHSHKVGNSLA